VKKKILFIDSVHEILQQKLEAAGYECDLHFKASHEEIISMLPEYFGVVIRSRIAIDKAVIDAATNLRFIARSGSGLDNIDIAYARSKNIEIFNSPEGNQDAVGEHAIGMLLMLLNNLKRADAEVREGIWKRKENEGSELSAKTVGIIGYGVMGSGLAKKLSGFGCRVIAHDKYKTSFSDAYATAASLEEIFSDADIVSIHLPLTPGTRHYADEKFFSSFSKPIVFINTARGKNVSTPALVAALRSGKVKGACIDVIEFESSSLEGLEHQGEHTFVYNELIAMDNVILTPHIAGWTRESYYKLSNVLAEKILSQFR